MRDCYVLLLAAGAFFVSAEGSSVATDSASGTSTSGRLSIAEKDDVAVSRFLRTAVAVPTEKGARKLAEAAFTSKKMPLEKLLKAWKANKQPSNYVFKELELPNNALEGGMWMDPHFPIWLRYTKDVAKDPVAAAFKTLEDHEYKIEDLYKALYFVERDDEMADMAIKLQIKLVKRWFEKQKIQINLRDCLSKETLASYPEWMREPKVLYRILQDELGDTKLARALEREIPDRSTGVLAPGVLATGVLAKRLQYEQFDDMKMRGIDLLGAFNLWGYPANSIMDVGGYSFWLKYVEHLLKMKSKDRLPVKLIKVVPKSFHNVLEVLTKAVQITTKNMDLFMASWAFEKIKPEDVSWLLGEQALEKGTHEHAFVEAYRAASVRMTKWD